MDVNYIHTYLCHNNNRIEIIVVVVPSSAVHNLRVLKTSESSDPSHSGCHSTPVSICVNYGYPEASLKSWPQDSKCNPIKEVALMEYMML